MNRPIKLASILAKKTKTKKQNSLPCTRLVLSIDVIMHFAV